MSAEQEEIVVTVRLFAMLRQLAGSDCVELRLPAGAHVRDALARLAEHEALRDVLGSTPVALAVNREYADASTPLAESDELALIPPLSGGSGELTEASDGVSGARVEVRVSEQPLDLTALAASVADARAGAVVLFEGVTRAVAELSYEAYAEMAVQRMRSIAQECASNAGALALAIEHRVGVVPLSEPSVIVAASAPHRSEAFAAARAAIDRVKAEVPIWKQEVEHDGARRWVEGTPAPTATLSATPAPGAALAATSAADAKPAPAVESRPTAVASDAASGATATSGLTHVGPDGRSRMVDVSAKPLSERVAIARARVRMSPQAAETVRRGDGPKGEVLGVARLAGIQAGKQTGQLIPLAHPLPLTFVDVRAEVDARRGLIELTAEARTVARTGVEMEAMTAASVAALTVYDMVKGLERGVSIEQVVLLSKRGGRSDYTRAETSDATTVDGDGHARAETGETITSDGDATTVDGNGHAPDRTRQAR